ncbi:MAG: YIP1 family protein [Holophagaceae bacterium]
MSDQPYATPEAELYGGGNAPKPMPPGLGAQIAGVFTEPTVLFQKLRAAPSWVPATILVAVCAVVAVGIWGVRVDWDAMLRPALEANPKVPAEQIDKIIEMQGRIMPFFAPVGAVIGMAVGTFLPALVFFLLGRSGAEEGSPSYSQALSATAVPNLILVPQQILIAVMCLATAVGGNTPDKILPTSLGYYLPMENPKLGSLLRHVDPFFIGVYVVTYLALRHLMKLKPAHAWIGTLICLATTLGFRVMGAR